MNKSAIILGIKAFNLSLDEERLLEEKKPLGVILFSRNIKTPEQMSASVKVKTHEKISEVFKGETRSNL